jgi:hypothetical protein
MRKERKRQKKMLLKKRSFQNIDITGLIRLTLGRRSSQSSTSNRLGAHSQRIRKDHHLIALLSSPLPHLIALLSSPLS